MALQPNWDLIAVQVGLGDKQVTLMNLYNAPPGSVDAREGLKHLLNQTLPTRPCLIAGDFNLHHSSWQTNAIDSAEAEPFLLIILRSLEGAIYPSMHHRPDPEGH